MGYTCTLLALDMFQKKGEHSQTPYLSEDKRIQLSSRDKGQKTILLVDSLLQCAQQQIDQFLAPTLDSLLRLLEVRKFYK